jgi:hypothetical protein
MPGGGRQALAKSGLSASPIREYRRILRADAHRFRNPRLDELQLIGEVADRIGREPIDARIERGFNAATDPASPRPTASDHFAKAVAKLSSSLCFRETNSARAAPRHSVAAIVTSFSYCHRF